MIKFRQKNYGWPLYALTAGQIGLSVKQANDAEQQNEELAEQARRDNAKTRKALEKLANSDAPPEAKAQAASLFSDLRLFAAPAAAGSILKNVGGFVKDLWTHSGSGVKKAAKLGAGFAATGYVGNRIATGLKNHDEGQDGENGKFLAKAAGTAAALGGGLLAAKKGYLGKGVRDFMTTGGGKTALTTAKKVLKENVSPVSKKGVGRYGINGINTIFLAAPTVSYLAQKSSQNGMVDNTAAADDDQKQYSIGASIAKAITSTKGAAKHLWRNPAQAITGGVNKVGNWFGMMGNKGGTTATQAGFKKLGEVGAKSGNKITQRVAEWGQNHKKAANLVTGVGALGVGGAAMGIGGKIVDKPMKVLDKEAYQMEEQENDKI